MGAEQKTCLMILKIINKIVKEKEKSIKMRTSAITFLGFILKQFTRNSTDSIDDPLITKLIESTLKNGFFDVDTQSETVWIMKTFKILNKDFVHQLLGQQLTLKRIK